MSVEVEFLGHSSFEIRSGKEVILIDPFLDENPAALKSTKEMNPTAIVVSHGHDDHIGETISIAKRTNALVIANFEIAEWLIAQGLENVHAQHIGGRARHNFGQLKLTIAHHGSMLPDGSYGGSPAGLLFELPGATIYHAGDTGLFLDMKLIGEAGLDLAIVPIGDNYTMGPEDGLRAIQFLNPKRAVPCHYNTWPLIEQDGAAWARQVTAKTSATGIQMNAGETISI